MPPDTRPAERAGRRRHHLQREGEAHRQRQLRRVRRAGHWRRRLHRTRPAKPVRAMQARLAAVAVRPLHQRLQPVVHRSDDPPDAHVGDRLRIPISGPLHRRGSRPQHPRWRLVRGRLPGTAVAILASPVIVRRRGRELRNDWSPRRAEEPVREQLVPLDARRDRHARHAHRHAVCERRRDAEHHRAVQGRPVRRRRSGSSGTRRRSRVSRRSHKSAARLPVRSR